MMEHRVERVGHFHAASMWPGQYYLALAL